ncbi:hypothetical protein BDN70DRAFT_885011 [Pholiota conissans]|uniref:Transmembrane protein n=1 Tax=Pholiota conissans TaxID=109636 RepID=A0A9P5YTE9_9AGAR|nr:hypothetical protein BDN70DRAFT_885011 [Pholiota conissans]
MSSSGASPTLHDALAQLGVTTALEKASIGDNLNASMFQALLMGIYTVVYVGTMYIYHLKASSKRQLVPLTVTLLYLANLAQFGIQWNAAKQQLVDNGDTRDTVFLALYSAPLRLWIPANLLNVLVLALGDGLLIWRCYNVWNCSVIVIALPSLLVFIEAALLIASTIGTAVVAQSKTGIMDRLSAAGFLLAACTTIITTTLIAYRIHTFLRNQDIAARRFKNIVDIVVQSGAVYALSMIVVGTSVMMAPDSGFESAKLYGFSVWTQAFAFPVAGISTAVMVARVAMLTDDTVAPATSFHISGLQFHARSTALTTTGAQLTVDSPSDDTELASASDGEKGSSSSNLEKKMVQDV